MSSAILWVIGLNEVKCEVSRSYLPLLKYFGEVVPRCRNQVNSHTRAWFQRILNLCTSLSKVSNISEFLNYPLNNDYFTKNFCYHLPCQLHLPECTFYYNNAVRPRLAPSENKCTLHLWVKHFYYCDS